MAKKILKSWGKGPLRIIEGRKEEWSTKNN